MSNKKELTAMQQFIKDMKEGFGTNVFTLSAEINYLKMEKKNITDAFYAGTFNSIGTGGEEYYNKKFNQINNK